MMLLSSRLKSELYRPNWNHRLFFTIPCIIIIVSIVASLNPIVASDIFSALRYFVFSAIDFSHLILQRKLVLYIAYFFGLTVLFIPILIYILTKLSKHYVLDEAIAHALFKRKEYNSGFKNHLAFPAFATNVSCKNGVLVFQYCIPDSSCLPANDDQLHFGLGEVLAFADEVTSILIISHDKTHRGGVSVVLSGEMYTSNLPGPGDILFVEAEASKLGATIGFSEMTLYASPGVQLQPQSPHVIAKVRHVKYLKQGLIWDMIGGAFPLIIRIINNLLPIFFKRVNGTAKKGGSSNLTGSSATLVRLSLQKSLGLNRLMVSTAETAASEISAPASAADATDTNNAICASSATKELIQNNKFTLVNHRGLMNPFSSMHGGAISCAVEQAALRFCFENLAAARDATLNRRWIVRNMEVEYLSPCKGELVLEVQQGPSGVSPAIAALSSSFLAIKDMPMQLPQKTGQKSGQEGHQRTASVACSGPTQGSGSFCSDDMDARQPQQQDACHHLIVTVRRKMPPLKAQKQNKHTTLQPLAKPLVVATLTVYCLPQPLGPN